MDPIAVTLTLAGLVALATALGLAWQSRQGRVRHTDGRTIVRATDGPGVRRLARGATLLQFSSEVCAPCVTTRTVLGDIAGSRTGVAHIDLDVTNRPDLASRFMNWAQKNGGK